MVILIGKRFSKVLSVYLYSQLICSKCNFVFIFYSILKPISCSSIICTGCLDFRNFLKSLFRPLIPSKTRVCVYVHMCVCVYVRACVRAHVYVCVCDSIYCSPTFCTHYMFRTLVYTIPLTRTIFINSKP